MFASGWGSRGWRGTAGGYGIFGGGAGECDEIVLELDSIDDCTTLNILKTIEFYTLKGGILWNVNYFLMKLIF